jgi:fructokinase
MSDATRPPEFIAWGELLWDLFPDTARLGGAAANAAYHAHCLGARSLLVSRVGRDPLGMGARAEL